MSGSSRRLPAFLPAFCALLFFVGFEMGGFQFALRGISAEFSIDSIGSGLLVAAQYSSVVLMPLFFGRLADRVGKRIVVLAFSVVLLLGCLLASLAGGVLAFAGGVFLIGAGYSVCETAGSAALADASPEQGARFVNLSQGALSLGAVVSPILTQFFASTLGSGWRLMFLLCTGGVAISFVLLLVCQIPTDRKPSSIPTSNPPARYFSDLPFALFFISILLYVGLENGFGYFTESLFTLELGAASFGAYAISAYWASMALSRLLFGLLPLRPERALVACLGISGALFFALRLLKLPLPALVVCALIGFAFGPVWSSLMNLAAARCPGSSGGAMGLMSAGCGLGGAVFPALMGLISARLNLRAAFLLLALAAAIAALLSLLAVQRTKIEPKG
ncbi:MAG: MFS transporter [Christensenella sp.]|nr:MFS transporter [Christensenella sp.]